MEIEYKAGYCYPKDTFKTFNEEVVRSIVGAPTVEESERCICGLELSDSNPDCYSHMTQGY